MKLLYTIRFIFQFLFYKKRILFTCFIIIFSLSLFFLNLPFPAKVKTSFAASDDFWSLIKDPSSGNLSFKFKGTATALTLGGGGIKGLTSTVNYADGNQQAFTANFPGDYPSGRHDAKVGFQLDPITHSAASDIRERDIGFYIPGITEISRKSSESYPQGILVGDQAGDDTVNGHIAGLQIDRIASGAEISNNNWKNYGIFINSISAAGPGISTNYGIRIKSISGAKANYGISVEDSNAVNFFAGPLVTTNNITSGENLEARSTNGNILIRASTDTTVPGNPNLIYSASGDRSNPRNLRIIGGYAGGNIPQFTVLADASDFAGSITAGSDITTGGNIRGGAVHFTSTAQIDGSVGIGVAPPSDPYKLNVHGAISTLSCMGCDRLPSDVRLKKNIQTIPDALNKILQIRGVMFNWRKDEFKDRNYPSGKQDGVIAQEVEKIFPELVTTDPQGYKLVNYQGLTPVLIEAIKDQQNSLQSQQKKIDSQQKEIDQLKKEVEILKNR